MAGLKAVLLHIETAFAHCARGESSGDDTAFTDAIYRANQAFEGSVKEAYRVLTGNDPAKKKPYEIEKFLEANQVLRKRVLEQLSNYRSQWRNPSTHDYILDFDQSESLFAVVSVSAFAAMLIDEIQQKLAFYKSQAEAAENAANESSTGIPKTAENEVELVEEVKTLLQQFCTTHLPTPLEGEAISEAQHIGAIQGFLSTVASHLQVKSEFKLNPNDNARVDLQISRGDEQVIVEIKRHPIISDLPKNLLQIDRYLSIGGMRNGVLLYLPASKGTLEVVPFLLNNRCVFIMSPEGFIATKFNS